MRKNIFIGEKGFEGYFTDSKDLVSRWYIRCSSSKDKIEKNFADMEYIDMPDAGAGESAFITAPMSEKAFKGFSDGLRVLSCYRCSDDPSITDSKSLTYGNKKGLVSVCVK
jgi:hypothetical protein